jgi:transaldolase
VLSIESLAVPDTINTIPADTLGAFAGHGHVTGAMPADGGDAEDVLRQFATAGVDVAALAGRLQHEGAQSFDDSWNKLMRSLASKSGAPTSAARSTETSS